MADNFRHRQTFGLLFYAPDVPVTERPVIGACGEPVNAYSEAATLCRAAEDRGPGRATRVTRRRARFGLHVRPRWVILIGKVVVVAGVHVPVAYYMAPSGHRLPWAPTGRILTAAGGLA
jgi:hypothetical protein